MKFIDKKFRNNIYGMTLAEVLIAIGLFAIIAVISTNITIDIFQGDKKSSVQTVLYEDIDTILQQLTYEIKNGTIDYEEYYNYYVIQEGDTAGTDDVVNYGMNYGVYGSRFFDPGKSLGNPPHAIKNPYDLGVECSYWHPDLLHPNTKCDVSYTLSYDLNTGQNPFYIQTETDLNKSDAFCENVSTPKGKLLQDGSDCDRSGETDHLFLIDKSGMRKTIIAKKKVDRKNSNIDWSHAIGLVRMKGEDTDQNGMIDTFSCFDEFNCNADKVPQKSDLEDAFNPANMGDSQFVPISPLRSDVKELHFIINPLEDPFKAYAEPKMQMHPTVTIFLTIELAPSYTADYPGKFLPLTVQATIEVGVNARINSYPPINEVKNKGAASYIDAISNISDVP